jgi:hypothetical protein
MMAIIVLCSAKPWPLPDSGWIGSFRYLIYNLFTRQDHTFQKGTWMGLIYRKLPQMQLGVI